MLFLKKIEKTIEYSLYLLVFLLPIQTRWIIKAGELNGGYWEYGTVSLYGTDILLFTLLFLFIVNLFLKQRTTNQEPRIKNHESRTTNFKTLISNSRFLIPIYWWLIAGLELMVFISIFFAADKLVAIYGYIRFLLGVGLFLLITNANYNKLKLIYSFFAGILLQACLGIWQFLSQSSFACQWLGIAAHSAGDLGVSVVETLAGERWLRAYGGLDHPNILGGLLAIGTLLIIGLIAKNYKAGISIFNFQFLNNFQFSVFKPLLTFYFLLFTFITVLFFTFSRGAWAGLLFGILVMLFIAVIRKDLKKQKKLLEIILASGILIFILFNLYQDLVLTRLSKDTKLEIKSNVERIESYKDSWQLIKDNWLFGVGIGNYTLGIRDWKSGIMDDMPSWYYQPVHNVFLLVWAEIGIFGLLFFIGLFILAWWNKNKSIQHVAWCWMPLVTALFVMFLVDHWWWSLHFGMLLFWLILGLLFKKGNYTYRD